MSLKINKYTRIADESILHFKSDDEFADFCVAPFVTLSLGADGKPGIDGGRHSDEYLKAIAEGKKFMIEDEHSWVYAHNCVTIRRPILCKDGLSTPRKDSLVQLQVENLEDYGFYLFECRHTIRVFLKSILYESEGKFDLELKKSGLTKEEIKPLADEGKLDARLVLLLGLTTPAVNKIWKEDFEDEEPHKVVKIDRYSYSDAPLFAAEPGEIEDLSKKLEAILPDQSTETLKNWSHMFGQHALYPAIHEELARRGDVEGLVRIGAIFAEGFESAGYKKDKEKAREYFDKALAAGWEKSEYDWNIEMLDYTPLDHPQDLTDDFDPRESIIMISGHPLYLDQIGYMVDDLTNAHGTPGNECGLFIPLEFVFKTLGFKWVHNTGNLMRFTRHSEPVLTIEIEANPHVDEALVEAFQKAYPLLTVEIVDND